MSEPITIGNSTYVKDPTLGWIDKKTKKPADEKFSKVLDGIAGTSEEQRVEDETVQAAEIIAAKPKKSSRKKMNIDTRIEPITIGNTTYVFDTISESWIDAKTKQKAPESLQKTIMGVINKKALNDILGVSEQESRQLGIAAAAAGVDDVAVSFGAAGIAATGKVKKARRKGAVSGGGTIGSFAETKKRVLAINETIVSMISSLASIDNSIKNMTGISSAMARNLSDQQDEANIENANTQDQMIEAEEKTANKGMDVGTLIGGGILAGILINNIDPIVETVGKLTEFAATVGSNLEKMSSSLNKFFRFFNDIGKPEEPVESNISPGDYRYDPTKGSILYKPGYTPGPGMAPTGWTTTGNQGGVLYNTNVPGTNRPMVSSADWSQAKVPPLLAKPGTNPTAQMKPMAPMIATPAPPSFSSNKPSATLAQTSLLNDKPAPTGSSLLKKASDEKSSTTKSAYADAPNGTMWVGTDKNGLKTFVWKINNRYETWTSANSTHYQITEAQALIQISSRNLKPANLGSMSTATPDQQYPEIPRNDIVALGNYLISQGAEKDKMEHQALSGRVGDHSRNSRHYRGMAIDVNFPGPNEAAILDELEPKLRAAGYNTIWRQPGHYTHMHVSLGGPEGIGGGESPLAAPVDAIQGMIEGIKALGSVFANATAGDVKIVKYDEIEKLNSPDGMAKKSALIQQEAAKMHGDKVMSVTPDEPKTTQLPQMPNLNAQTPELSNKNMVSVESTAKILDMYMHYFRVKEVEVSTPAKPIFN